MKVLNRPVLQTFTIGVTSSVTYESRGPANLLNSSLSTWIREELSRDITWRGVPGCLKHISDTKDLFIAGAFKIHV